MALKNKSRFSCIKKPRGQTKAWIKGGRIQKWHSRLQKWFIQQRKDFERKQAEIREREEETKRKTEEFRESFLSELTALLKREKFGALIKLSARDNRYFRFLNITKIIHTDLK